MIAERKALLVPVTIHPFTHPFPFLSALRRQAYDKEYEFNEHRNQSFTPYEFNSTLDSGTWDDCNSHAFCYSSMSAKGELNLYSRAVVAKYSTIYAAQVFFNNFEF